MKRGEKGFTLIQVLVAVAIVAMIGAGVGVTTVQIINNTQQNNDWTTAIRPSSECWLLGPSGCTDGTEY